MRPRKLVLRPSALRDIARHEAHLKRVRGAGFARLWRDSLVAWLERQAALGAQYGTEHPRRAGYRTFGYRGQATILAEFTADAMDVVRVSFAGQDWQA